MHWEYAVPIATIHVLTCLVFVPWCFSWSGVIIAGLGTVVFGTLGINLGYHRLLSHRSLSVPLWLERTLATLAVCSLEDTPSRWVANHRLHHCHSDDEPDPHSPRDGVAWSHMGWLFRHVPHRKSINFLDKYARDILVDPYYRALEQHPMAVLWIYIACGSLRCSRATARMVDLGRLESLYTTCCELYRLGCLFTHRSCLAYHVEREFTHPSFWIPDVLDGRR